MSRLFGPVRQNGYIVRDIHAAMNHWIEFLGVGPWFFIEDLPFDSHRYRGVPSDVKISLALANSGDLQIELIQPRNDAPSMYRDFLASGREGLQHVAFWTHEFQKLYDHALALRYAVETEGSAGGERGRFAFFDSHVHPGTAIELLDVSGANSRIFAHIKKKSEGWDGSDPIRTLR